MKNIIFIISASLIFTLGCQSTNNSRWLTPTGGSGAQFLGQAPFDDSFFTIAPFPAPTTSTPTLDPFAPIQQHAIGSDLAAEEAEKQRIRALATAPRADAPDHLQPFNPWFGPFENRVRRTTLEQDIIRQVGYDQVSAKIHSSAPVFDWEIDEPKRGFDWSVLDPVNFFTRVRDWMGLGPDENKANEAMKKGREILLSNPDLQDKAKNREAAKHFATAAKRFPNSVLEEDALHLAAECYFFADDYYNAFQMYQKLLMRYRHSKHLDNAARRLFSIARYWELESERSSAVLNVTDRTLPRFDTFGFAKKAYETIFINDPNGPVSDDALMALATAYLKRGRHQGDDNFNQAAYYYQRLREDHPLSKHIARAYENELFARTQAYLGAEHPSRTLEEARKLAEITMRQFGGQLEHEERAVILGMKESILEKQAERLWTRAQYYDMKKRHYGSARLYYERLIREFPQTEFAERARRRMVEIEDLPDTPSIFAFPVNPFKSVH